MLFPLPKLLLCIAGDDKSSNSTLKIIKPFLERMRDNEYVKRTMISDLGVKNTERLALKNRKSQQEEDEYECETCSANLYVSFVCDVKEDQYYCLDCAVKYLQSKKASQRKHCKLLYTHSKEEISAIIKDVNQRLDDDSSSDEDSDSDYEIKTKRISELSKEKKKPTVESPTVPKVSSPPPSTSSRPKLAGPNVPPGTSINVSSFSLVKHATKKALADDKTKGGKKPSKLQAKAETDTSEEDDEDTSEEDSEDSEVQISREAMKKAEKLKQKEKASKPKKKPPTPTPPAKKSSTTPKSTPKATPKSPPPTKPSSSKKSTPKAGPSSSRGSRGSSSQSSRKTKARKASSSKTGNLASELLDMLLSTDEDSNASDSEMDSSDEAWK